jgi:hypothetical protein
MGFDMKESFGVELESLIQSSAEETEPRGTVTMSIPTSIRTRNVIFSKACHGRKRIIP